MTRFSRLTAIIALLFCTSCGVTAGGPKFQPPTSYSRDKATVFLYRGGGIVGSDRPYAILANGNFVGSFAQYSYASFETDANVVNFAWIWTSQNYALRFAAFMSGVDISDDLTGATQLLSIQVQPGKAYFVKLEPTTGRAYASLRLADPDDAAKEIGAYHLWADVWTDAMAKGNAALTNRRDSDAVRHYNVALDHLEKAPYKCAEPLARDHLGIALYNLQNPTDAEAEFKKAQDGWKACKDKDGYMATLRNYAAMLRQEGRDEEAAALEAELKSLEAEG